MKADIHPQYNEVNVTCSCGNEFKTRSTFTGDVIQLDVCAKCHPFYTGKQKIIDTGGRIDRFNRKFKFKSNKKADADNANAEGK